MASPPRVALPPYTFTKPPVTYNAGWLATELQRIQRAVPVPSIRQVAASVTATTRDETILVDASGGAVTVTLPQVSASIGLRLTIKKVDASVHAVTIGGTVDGAVNPTLTTQYAVKSVQSDGTNWWSV